MSARLKKLKLMWRCKTPKGWRRFPAIIYKEHKRDVAQIGVVMDGGKRRKYPNGYFQLRKWENGRQVYLTLPDHEQKHGRDAVLAWERETRKAQLAAGQRKKAKTIKAAIADYISDLERKSNHEAAENARLVLPDFEEQCASMFVNMISRECVSRYVAALKKRKIGRNGNRHLSLRTIENRFNRVKSFLKFCALDTDKIMPTDEVAKPEKKADPTIYNPAQIDAIRAAADDYLRLVIDMALMLGLREQELMYATWADVDFYHATYTVRGKPEYEFRVKDNAERVVPIPAELLSRLQEQRNQEPESKLILGTRNDAPNGHMLRSLKRLAQKAGLNCGQCRACLEFAESNASDDAGTERPKRNGKSRGRQTNPTTGQECQDWTLHKFRRTYLTTLLRQGIDAKTVQDFAGHSDLETTLKYLRAASAPEMRAKINAITWGSNTSPA
ncbi:MAG TPA: tyrosine-type recombinase/integrase [Terracidiphilus sp.]|nr:tyrosine-type recombinase/integrase [Terracidiphilus sp.]